MINQTNYNERFSINHIVPFVLIWLAFMGLFHSNAQAAKPSASGINIEKITIGEERISTGRNQLIEVVFKNITQNKVSAKATLSIVLPNHNIVSFGKRHLVLEGRSETRVLFPYPISKNAGGDYTIGVKLFSPGGKVIAQSTEEQKKFFFAVDPTRRNQQPKRPKAQVKTDAKATDGLTSKETIQSAALFDPPDLTIEEISIVNNNSILRGETAYARLILANIGGDIAQEAAFSVYWYFAPRDNRKVKAFGDLVNVIAPGERKILDVPVTIPENEQKGEYFFYAVFDEANLIKEIDEKNNTATSNQALVFSDIAQVFPQDEHSFAEDGLFKFQWRSKKFNQFKIQISADKLFANHETMFEMPKGDEPEGWTPENMMKPLSGEMPSMALALMKSDNIDHLYWRVKAKDSEGNTTESASRRFYISFKAAQN